MTIETVCRDRRETDDVAPLRHRVTAAFKALANTVARRRRIRRTRIHLAGLSAEQLRDIGLSREQADAETRRSLFLAIERTMSPK
ncbi:DUF1127 domain-containing protein [Ciceribacter thiooxidans]|uniref:DUF1127 domain-containing protein n=1 Tax=Ciceribacter thiooxidans TaxID=1969821 RepID=A0ABV7I814_9HYPH|nr:DUF1127 domain-containing protein [Ciceribacter thiooxidans]